MTYLNTAIGACKLENASTVIAGSDINAFSSSIGSWFFYSQNKIPALGSVAITVLSTVTTDQDTVEPVSTIEISSRRVGSFMGYKLSNSQQTILPTLVVNNQSFKYNFLTLDSGDTILAQNIDTFIIPCR